MKTPMNTSAWWMPSRLPATSVCSPASPRREVAVPADQHGGQADEAVQDRDQLGHAGHLDLARPPQADRGADDHGDDQQRDADARRCCGDGQADRRDQRDGHAGDAEDDAGLAVSCLDSPARLRMNSRAGDDVGRLRRRWWRSSARQPFENMPSMRRVTAKPPKMLMLASRIATNGQHGDHGVVVADLQQRADHDDPGDRVGDRHQRRVQRVVHVADDVVADDDRQHEHGEVWISWFGENAVSRNSSAAAEPDQGVPPRPAVGGAFGCSGFHRRGGAGAGAAETCTGGGGQVFSPSRTTVIARWTTSSKSRTSCAVLARRQQLHQVDQVGAVELRGLGGQPAGAGRCSR